ncbi:hypothetical protein HY991_01390 [Candidatus Micrarchaeota archaeon]|nr:hypothetical protein [Candidatus Micrarchaeota archaeon]
MKLFEKSGLLFLPFLSVAVVLLILSGNVFGENYTNATTTSTWNYTPTSTWVPSPSPTASPSVSPTPSPIPSNCSDSDGGYNVYTKGTCAPWGGTDYCASSTVLHEFTCVAEPGCVSYNTTCPVGYNCLNGACVPSTNVTNCTDSDGGYNIYTRGSCYSSVYGYSLYDYCLSSSQLVEFYCSAGACRNSTVTCPSGYTCSVGACVRSSVQCNKAPSVSITPSLQYGLLGQTLNYTVNIQSMDDKGCNATYFSIMTQSVPFGWRTWLSTYSVRLSPGELKKVIVYVTSPANVRPCGDYYFGVKATASYSGASRSAYAMYGLAAGATTPTGSGSGQAGLAASSSLPGMDVITMLLQLLILLGLVVFIYDLRTRKAPAKAESKAPEKKK